MTTSTVRSFLKVITVVAIIVLLFSSNLALAAKKPPPRTSDVVVVRPTDLPQAARVPGQAMYLLALGFCRYLYVEENEGRRLVVFDVSKPAHVKTVAEIELRTSSFEFLGAVNDRLVLVHFTDPQASSTFGILNVHHPKKPMLRPLINSETSSSSAFSIAAPEVQQNLGSITGLEGVRQEITDKDLGSSFVLAADGLWIIRHPAVEKHYEIEEFQSYAG